MVIYCYFAFSLPKVRKLCILTGDFSLQTPKYMVNLSGLFSKMYSLEIFYHCLRLCGDDPRNSTLLLAVFIQNGRTKTCVSIHCSA